MNVPLQVRVRPAQPDDDAALAELETVAWSAESGFPSVSRSAGDPDIPFFSPGSPPQVHLVAEVSGAVVGYVRLKPPTSLPENTHVIQVQGLAVHPAVRRRGVASTLLTASEQYARERGARKLTLRVLSTNRAALRLYEQLGFAREGVLLAEFFINGTYVNDVLMAKSLGH